MTNKKILITGSAGFIGTNLTKNLLDSGSEVIGVDNLYCSNGKRNNVDLFLNNARYSTRYVFFNESVVNPFGRWDEIKKMEIDRIYHLACPASPPKYQRNKKFTIDTCVIGTQNMLELAHSKGARLLFSSTSEVYGNPLVHPQTEEYFGNVNPIGIRSCYDEGKRLAETECFNAREEQKTDVRIARIFNTYGPFMEGDDGRIVSTVINQALRNEDITLFGDGKQTRSFCYVNDLVEGLVRYMNCEAERFSVLWRCSSFGPINLGNPVEFTMIELAQKVISMAPGYKGNIVHKELPKDDPVRRKPDISKARRVLDWEPKIGFGGRA